MCRLEFVAANFRRATEVSETEHIADHSEPPFPLFALFQNDCTIRRRRGIDGLLYCVARAATLAGRSERCPPPDQRTGKIHIFTRSSTASNIRIQVNTSCFYIIELPLSKLN